LRIGLGWLFPPAVLALVSAFGLLRAADRKDLLIADFEGKDYGGWKVTGTAFGRGPARGTLPNQMEVSGYLGKGLVNSYVKGDGSVGTLTSPEFKIARRRINFLIGGGNHPGQTCINLVVGGKVVRTATGRDSEHLDWHSWDVTALAGKTARIEIGDKHRGGWGHILIDHIVQSDRRPKPVDERKELLERAEASVRKAAQRVRADRDRPVYHLLPPGQWLNDPNGPVFYKGWYHLFYQHNPYGDAWGHMHWGHWRSRDLVHWEQLPIALWPSRSRGEEHVFSGCAVRPARGKLMLFYTSIGKRLPEQWAAVPEDDQLLRWKKHPANPILTEKLHGRVKVHEWRDPFVFHHDRKTYMVLGGNLNASKGGRAVVNVYRAENVDLTRWKYLGVLFQHPDKDVKNIECPNFFQLGKKWVLIVSQGKPVHYFTGSLDAKAMKFRAEHRGVMDWGDYYAPNCLKDAKGRRILWGWVQGFKAGRGWNGCLTLPRVQTVGKGGQLLQQPAPELAKLRGKALYSRAQIKLADSSLVLKGVAGDTLEIEAEFIPGTAKHYGLKVRHSPDGKQAFSIAYDGKQLEVAGSKFPVAAPEKGQGFKVRVFLDRSVLEVYTPAGGCVTQVIYPGHNHRGVEVFAQGGTVTVKNLTLWPMESIWRKAPRR
jgi:sucrose-6-phosphate hydrolase SacC (GH32 family)